MIHFKGVVEKTINGKAVMFKFNMAALTYFGDIANLSIKEVGQELIAPKLSTLANFFYASAVTYCKQEKKTQEFTQDDACEWVAALGFEEAIKLFGEAFESPEEKNP